ncbi:TPA: hypothetical protein ACT2FD_002069, partial [Streptococcus suis]
MSQFNISGRYVEVRNRRSEASVKCVKKYKCKKDVVFLQRLFVWLTSGFLLAADLKWQIIGFSKSWRE